MCLFVALLQLCFFAADLEATLRRPFAIAVLMDRSFNDLGDKSLG